MRPLIVELFDRWHLGWLVPTAGLVNAVLFLALGTTFLLRARRRGVEVQRSLELVVAAGFGAAIGARLFYLLTTGEIFTTPISLWADPRLGTASWGAYLGATAGLAGYSRLARLAPIAVFDLAASVAGLAEAIGRIGCLLAGDDFGRITNVTWAIRFPRGSLPYLAHVRRGLLDPAAALSLPVHPLQLYLLGNALLVFVVVSALWRPGRSRPGLTLAAYLTLHGATRFWWEFLRDPAGGGAEVGLSISQRTCLVFVAAGLVVAFGARARHPALGRSFSRRPGHAPTGIARS